MLASVKRFPANADPHEVHQYLNADSVVVVEGAATRDSIDTVMEEVGSVGGCQPLHLLPQSFSSTLHHITHPAKRETDFGIAYPATDITKENGAIRVVIGSNSWRDERDPSEKDEYLVELRKGDSLVLYVS
ncbi:hypothetical protein BS50DRAFT_631824 [Corynespora cassiicola Philippines]|uniref:Uncharacterized protein n=1 Tax=Corynespora cassiicola Philippines TaxID=1448308 RepID=A0A2T2NWQ9_CORCC|nr:hypothetical protein BS50DRAFT_631824 [Corynespora cassiicola Philippines]